MTLLLDAFALIAVVAGEPAAPVVERELRRAEADVCISTVNYAEVLDQLIRVARLPAADVDAALQLLAAGGMRVVAVDEESGHTAGLLRARHYRRGVAAVSLADCFAVAVAASLHARLATADPALLAIAASEGIEVLRLPGSSQGPS